MLIANPIYDAAFKYLMEDPEVSKGFLSTLLTLDIVEVEFKPTELTFEKMLDEMKNLSDEQKKSLKEKISVIRYDFKVVSKEANGEFRTILIEIQKSHVMRKFDRFRDYISESYKRKETVKINNILTEAHLEIICVYFLNTTFKDTPIPIIKTENTFIDAETNKPLLHPPSNKFMKLLLHRAYFIQIPLLKGDKKTKIKKLLDIFEQENKFDDFTINYDYEIESELKKKMIERLQYVLMDEKSRKIMKTEKEIDEMIEEYQEEMSILLKENQKNKKTIEEKDNALKEKDNALKEKDNALENSIIIISKYIIDPKLIADELKISLDFVLKVLNKNKK